MGDVDGRADINNELYRIRSDKVEIRSAGLNKLREIVSENRQGSGLRPIKDSGFHIILEAGFRAVKVEISHYIRASSKLVRSKTETRLSACAALLRVVIEVAVSKIRYKTVKAVVEHIIQTLPTADGGYYGPLLKDYWKALLTLLEHKSHPEHFLGDEWSEVVDFCLATARDLDKPYELNESDISNGTLRISKAQTSRSATPNTVPERTGLLQLRECDREIFACLQQLSATPNAPIFDRAATVLTTLVDLLQSYPKTKLVNVQQAVFECINSLMSRIVVNDVSLSLRTVQRVIPVIRRLWDPKPQTSSYKDCLLIFLTHTEIFLPRMIAADDKGDCNAELRALVDTLRDDYCMRMHREQLQIEDLAFIDPTRSQSQEISMSTRNFEIRQGAFKAEHPWCLLASSAAIVMALENDIVSREKMSASEEREALPKKQKLVRPLDDIFGFVRNRQLPEKTYALQMLAFIFNEHDFDKTDLRVHMNVVLPCLSDDDSLTASWAMLAMTSATNQRAAQTAGFQDFWLEVWRLTARHITSTSICRSACHLMTVVLAIGLVQYANISDLVDGMTRSIDLNGPVECDEAATTLWSMLLICRGRENINSSSDMTENVLHWLFNRWRPGRLIDRQHTIYISQQSSTMSILRLICLCLGLPPPSAVPRSTLNLGTVSQARFQCLRNRELLDYLLLTKTKSMNRQDVQITASIAFSELKTTSVKFQSLSQIVLDFLISEGSALVHNLFSSAIEPVSFVNANTVRISFSFVIVSLSLLSTPKFQSVHETAQFGSILEDLTKSLKNCMLHHAERRELIKGALESFDAVLGTLKAMIPGHDLLFDGTVAASKGLDKEFWYEVMHSNDLNHISFEQDVMDLGDEFQSRRPSSREETSTPVSSHYEVAAATNSVAFRASIVAKVCFLANLYDRGDNAATVPSQALSSTIEYLTSLQRQDFVVCRSLLRELLDSCIPISEDDADTLLQYLAQALLRPYEMERSEVSMGVTLDVMTRLAEMWTLAQEGSDLADTGAALYKWFIDIALKKGIASPHVHVCISTLLHTVIKIQPEFARSLHLESARTCLFKVLREGDVVAKFHIGNNIADIFGLFVLKEHENILEDVISSLPNDQTWLEGISLRLYVLARLAASWSTLLRRCVYALLECPTYVPESTGHAEYCLKYATLSLKLAQPQDLFKLFVSQILYTWLDAESLRSFPYKIFGYHALSTLLLDVQDEIVGQTIMRGKDDQVKELAKNLEQPFEKLLDSSFSKASAYCISRDTAVSASTSTQGLKDILGKEHYSSLATRDFAKILAIFFKTMDPDGQIERGFQKHPESAQVYSTYQMILSKGVQDKVLPTNQQPSFKARFLFDEIEYLCRRTGYDSESLWSPALYIYVFREVMNGMHPALGSLHACSVLRRVRILISMAGPVALEYYPLEMGLQSLQPYLTDAQCAAETIGLFEYLLEYGAQYLKEVPSFMAGLAVSTLTSMKEFFESTQDSTTQESQFKATISRAQVFHSWFSRFLAGYVSRHLSEDSARCFTTIVNAASNIQVGGNARTSTYESELLLELLEDQRSGRNLLDPVCRDTILKFLCTPFELPQDFREDITGTDDRAVQYASTIWKTCQSDASSEQYLLWAGRALGRAYAGKGLVHHEMIYETSSENVIALPSLQTAPTSSTSKANILRLLRDLLSVGSSTEVGMAETTLRSIVTKIDGTEYYQECEQVLSPSLSKAMLWTQHHLPDYSSPYNEGPDLQESVAVDEKLSATQWIQKLCIALAITGTDDAILSELTRVLCSIEAWAEKAFPYMLHLILLREVGKKERTKVIMLGACQQWFRRCIGDQADENTIYSVRVLLRAILYLNTQPLPYETAKADRTHWLKIDYKEASTAAVKCRMYKTALMFLEIDYSEAAKGAKPSKRSSAVPKRLPEAENPDRYPDLLLEIYQNIDEQDAFYGVQQPSSLSSMMSQLEYEHAGFKSLSFRGAHYDAQIRQSTQKNHMDEESMIRALDNLDLNGLSQSLLSKMTHTGIQSLDSALRTARKLEQWDISAPTSHYSSASTLFRVFQGINNASNIEDVKSSINSGLAESMNRLLLGKDAKSSMHSMLGTLAILTEADEFFSTSATEQLHEILERFEKREHWMSSESYEHIVGIISCRETMVSSLRKKAKLQDMLRTTQRDAHALESHLLLASSQMSRLHGALQNSLSTMTYLTNLVQPCEEAGVEISAAVQFESANVLWAQGEMTASIRMLQDLQKSLGSQDQLIHVGRPELLAKIGHQISEARLEKPDEIINRYLSPAIKELHGSSSGDEAGGVFHEFAAFCDQQLQNQDGLEDFERIQKLRDRKEAEVEDLDRMIKSTNSQAKERANLKAHRDKAKSWFDLDDREFQRLYASRQTFLRQSLENYLLCLKACDKYDNDALRFSALWLGNHDAAIANEAVSRHVGQVASRKFAALMNQWSSRLLNDNAPFQRLLSSLVTRICIEHPYHGMYQIFAGSKSKGGRDEIALSRNAAANNIVQQLKDNKHSSATWLAVHNTNIAFVRFAAERSDDSSIKPGSKVLLRKFPTGQRIEQDVLQQKVPPPTARISLRPDCDYSNVPTIARFQSEFTIASGISMPKIITAIGTDGLKYKQLFKSGNDDLRQDAIMEQVFEQVSSLLRSQRTTRQRNLGIRNYKVLPLTSTAGIIEFVPNTIPLHDYLMPAHQRHFPKDLKPNNARKYIADAQQKPVDHRIRTYRNVCDQFHPVLRYFFMERFENPDDWFEKRLAYTRSTAAISILGHVLGLGDRHGHNILLDEKTGEVVHIDLGIAFEQGRVLPVPEVVPFRLTRDLIDGMGITKTEGVFRRCCEFTLEALRNESYSIMTILDVLRYDPLYSWSLSPLRLKKMQDAQTEDPRLPRGGGGGEDGAGGKKKAGDAGEPGEAERALTVVRRKLSKSLSVQATVNELIQAATDERNLAVLFAGWAAYA